MLLEYCNQLRQAHFLVSYHTFLWQQPLFTHVEKPSSKSNLTISFPKDVLNLSGYPNFKTAMKKCLHESLPEAMLPV